MRINNYTVRLCKSNTYRKMQCSNNSQVKRRCKAGDVDGRSPLLIILFHDTFQ